MTKENPRSSVVAAFQSLEEQLLTCLQYIPYSEQNKNVASPKFVPILMDTCSLIDSVFRHTVGGDQRHSLKNFAESLEGRLWLEEATSLFLISPMRLLRPFKGWRQAAPSWWDAYNRVKHDRIQNHDAATLEQTVMALAGLHQVLSRTRSFLSHLATAGWFNEADDNFIELFAMDHVGCGPPGMPVETKLFVSATTGGDGTFVNWDTDPPTIDYQGWNFSWRVKLFIFEAEDW
jgi:hypothetical protein